MRIRCGGPAADDPLEPSGALGVVTAGGSSDSGTGRISDEATATKSSVTASRSRARRRSIGATMADGGGPRPRSRAVPGGAAMAARRLPDQVARSLAMDAPFVALLLAASVVDVRRRVIPNRLVVVGVAWALGSACVAKPEALPELALAGCGAFLALLVPALIRPAALGMGDVKLAGVMGLSLGASVAPALVVAFLAGAVAGVAVVALRGLEARKSALPFAPFLAVGGVVGLVAGPALIGLYLGRAS